MLKSELALALRCQRLTGSYTGKKISCDCAGVRDCALSEEQRQRLADNPYVKLALKQNQEAYRKGLQDRLRQK